MTDKPPSGQTPARQRPKIAYVLRRIAVVIGFGAVVVLLMLWLAGAFHSKIGAAGPAQTPSRPIGAAQVVEVRTIRVPIVESAVGSVRSVHETSVASKVLARVDAVHVRAGQRVTKGELLVELDDADLRARVQQAEAAVAAGSAARKQAQIESDRVQDLFAQGSAAKIELDRVSTALATAQAELERNEQSAAEVRSILGYARIEAPSDAVVIDKRVEVGDTVTPGQVVVSLYDPTRMQLVASVRESLTRRLKVGQTIDVQVDAVAKKCQGLVSEIVPEAESGSRTFAVKVTGPCPPGVYAGMFGRLFIPLDEQDVLVVPESAIRRVGQLDMVEVVGGKEQNTLHRRVVQLGRSFGDDRQVLSGLRAGETVAVHPSGTPGSE